MVLAAPGQIIYDAAGNPLPVSSVTLSNLKAGTSYVVQVQAVGGDNNAVSDWSVGYVFVVPNLT
jgi:hypothetical protein